MKIVWNYIKRNLVLLVLVCSLVTGAVTGMVLGKYADDKQASAGINIMAQGTLTVSVSEPTVSNNVYSYALSNTNESNINVYVRATVVVNWQDSEGNLWAIPPKKEVDYFITATNCTKLDDGYYYYNGSCAPNATFPILVGLAANAKPPVGYTLHVQILAEGIQCVPDTAVQETWGATYNGTTWSKDN